MVASRPAVRLRFAAVSIAVLMALPATAQNIAGTVVTPSETIRAAIDGGVPAARSVDTRYRSWFDEYYLEDNWNTAGAICYDASMYSDVSPAVAWFSTCVEPACYAVSSHSNDWISGALAERASDFRNVERVLSLFRTRFGREGADGAGQKVTVLSGLSLAGAQASPNFRVIAFGRGDTGSGYASYGVIDVAAHEFGHLVNWNAWERSSDYTEGSLRGVRGSVDEHLADMFGVIAKYYLADDSWVNAVRWVHGAERRYGTNYLLSKAAGFAGTVVGDRSYYLATDGVATRAHISQLDTSASDNGGVHSNALLLGRAFYLFSEGGTAGTAPDGTPLPGWPASAPNILVRGIGMERFADLTYRVATSSALSAIPEAEQNASAMTAELEAYAGLVHATCLALATEASWPSWTCDSVQNGFAAVGLMDAVVNIGLTGDLAFGNVMVGTTATRTLTISNSGAGVLTVTGISYPAGFTGAWSGTIAAGGSQNIAVTFVPTEATTYGGVVTVSGDQTNGTNTIAASGMGIPVPTPVIGLSGDLAFGNVTVNSTATRTLTISNTGTATLTVSGITYPAGFTGVWSGAIAAGGSHDVTVTFAPTTVGAHGGTVTVHGDQTSGTSTIAVSGTARLPARLDFNADGFPDLVWRNRVTGEMVFWLMNGATRTSEVRVSGPPDRRAAIVAVADFNGDDQPDLVFRNPETGDDFVWYMNGTTHTGTAALPKVADARWQIAAAVDFNADRQPDLLWRNGANGDVVVWYLNGATYAGYDWVASIKDPVWVMAGVDDFNGDGDPDIVWRNASDGRNLVWYMNGAAYAEFAWLPTEADTNWVIVGVADYDGDGQPDLLWRNSATGENRLWRMNNAALLGTDTLPAMTEVDYEAIGAEAGRTRTALNDFNADGHPDILWHNDATGESGVWYMAGSKGDTRLADVSLGTETDLNWKTVAVADFNEDGLPDIVWRNSATGQNKIALMTGRTKTGEMTLPRIADTNWQIVGIGDFNQDGHPDLAWRNYATGQNVIWFLKNGAYFDWTAPPTITDTNWKIVAVGDFNGDGWPDLFWRNSATGVNIAWFLVKGVYAGWGQPPTIADPTWQIVGANDYNDDGKADLLWRNASDGRNLIWYLRDGAYLDFARLPTLDIAWKTGGGQ